MNEIEIAARSTHSISDEMERKSLYYKTIKRTVDEQVIGRLIVRKSPKNRRTEPIQDESWVLDFLEPETRKSLEEWRERNRG